ncbi:D-psicose 3-epimerase [Meiothermus luteus]|jgi:sugar phosphate isomerase/epimerase|uniref:D-psicose 3-epimerase n=1 Tax=Meiothermus luteus TaxID=2026184 RepID=A0A399ESC6_9DEIN|nr:sugar phosphate isomerase/epimerase family protein [Meiothermus luteus]RIH85482.1 D-psicose 3-epimerase [Meiothermus luteus]RMH58186.1 MAG: sugar phosphate isomerase/epimerase [Deinococcota bacterium]
MRPLGVCTWTFGPLPLPEVLERVARLGLEGVELLGEVEGLKPAQVRAWLAERGLEVFSLTPANVDLAHPEPVVRGEALGYYLRLIDFAAELGRPTVSCHGAVGRVAPLASLEAEWGWLAEGVAKVCDRAAQAGLEVVFEVLNRYESHLVNTAAEALRLLAQVGRPNLKVLLDAYHMNLEEADPAGAVLEVGPRLGLFHLADSNRRGLGRGHTDFARLLRALEQVGYAGPLILELTTPGPNPFTPVKPGDYLGVLERDLAESRAYLKALGN